MIAEGDQAPAVSVPCDDGKTLDLAKYRGKRNVGAVFLSEGQHTGLHEGVS